MNIYDEVKNNINDIFNVMEEWWDYNNDYSLNFMNAIIKKQYENIGKNFDDEDDEDIFQEMISLSTVYGLNKDSQLYKTIKKYSVIQNKQLSEYFIDMTDNIDTILAEEKKIAFTKLIINDINITEKLVEEGGVNNE